MADLFFTSKGHRERFVRNMEDLGKIYDGRLDEEYGACLYILTSSAETWQNARRYVTDEGIDIETMLEYVDFSGGYTVLIRLAANLFNDRTGCSPVDLATRLDDTNFQVAMTALQLRRVSLPLDEIASKAELYQIEIDERLRIQLENREKPWLPPSADGEL